MTLEAEARAESHRKNKAESTSADHSLIVMDVGAHCFFRGCHQQDFLPFTCDCCDHVYCLDHRSYETHACPSAGKLDRRVLQCPLCKQHIPWTLEQDANEVWDLHMRLGKCAPPSGAAATAPGQPPQKKKKKRCSADKCREVLVTSNTFRCQRCRQDVCMRHRFETDHDCETVRQSQQQTWFSRPSTGAGSAQRKASTGNSASVTGFAARDAQRVASNLATGTKNAAQSVVQAAKQAVTATSKSSGDVITTSSDECPMCHQKFRYVSQLIAHVNNAHPETSQRGAAASAVSSAAVSSSREVCPQCQMTFKDVGALIQHAETAHSGAVAARAGGSGGGSDDKCSLM